MAQDATRLRCAFVVPWYGDKLPGGAEAEARRTAQELAAAGVEVRVLTTCLAGLGSDWDHDSLPAGESLEDGVLVRRFPSDRRDGAAFAALNTRVMAGDRLSGPEEETFLRNMVFSRALMDHIAQHPEQGPFFFIPYLWTTSIWGPRVHPAKSVIIPCLHDEGYARLEAVKNAFEAARAVVFHVPAERDLGARLYDLAKTEPLVLGEGIDTGWTADGERFRQKYEVDYPFILYAGRKDAGKNVPLLVQYFLRYKAEGRGPAGLKLLFIGNLPAPVPPSGREHCRDLGFVPRQDKYDAYAAADILAQPSLMESFSIVIMEAWLAGTPVMVHSGCAVTAQHAEVSGGGLHFRDYPHFAECLDIMFSRPQLRADMAAAGKRYVLENYSWPVVTQRFVRLLERLAAEPYPPAQKAWRAPAEARAAARSGGPRRPAVHQMLPDFEYGDAIGSDVLALQKVLQGWGLESTIFASHIHPRLRGAAQPAQDLLATVEPQDIVIYHFSVGHEIWDQLPKWPGRKVMRYHNITPATFLERCNPEGAERCRLGRQQLPRLAQVMELGMGVSAYNCAELAEAGFPATAEVPILLDLGVLKTAPDPMVLDRFNDGRPNVLHVGRIAPNKAIEDLIKSHACLARLVPGARLLLVGRDDGWAAYAQGLRDLVDRLNVPDVHFSGHVSFPALMAYYRAATMYLCLSEHEGFCVPLVESMHFGLPIVAYAAAGVPGTLGDGGLLLPAKPPAMVAEACALALTEPAARETLVAAGRRRLERFAAQRVRADLQEALRSLGVEV